MITSKIKGDDGKMVKIALNIDHIRSVNPDTDPETDITYVRVLEEKLAYHLMESFENIMHKIKTARWMRLNAKTL